MMSRKEGGETKDGGVIKQALKQKTKIQKDNAKDTEQEEDMAEEIEVGDEVVKRLRWENAVDADTEAIGDEDMEDGTEEASEAARQQQIQQDRKLAVKLSERDTETRTGKDTGKGSGSSKQVDKKSLYSARAWTAKQKMSSAQAYTLATTPHKADKQQDTTTAEKVTEHERKLTQLAEDMKILKTKRQLTTTQEQMPSHEVMTQALIELEKDVRSLTLATENIKDDIGEMKLKTDYTHDLVLEAARREAACIRVIKSWPDQANWQDRVRITEWLLNEANRFNWGRGVEISGVYQEHGRKRGQRWQLDKTTKLHFQNPDQAEAFEVYAFTSFSGRNPLTYWDAGGTVLMHNTGSPHRLTIARFLTSDEQTVNMALKVVHEIATSHENSPYRDSNKISHRESDKMLYNTLDQKPLAVAKYIDDAGSLQITTDYWLVDILKDTKQWQDSWATVFAEHPKWRSYSTYPYVCTFAAFREESNADATKGGHSDAQGAGSGKGGSKGRKGDKGKTDWDHAWDKQVGKGNGYDWGWYPNQWKSKWY